MTEQCHAGGVWVEAELGEVGGKDGAHAPGVRTDPDAAADFVRATGVDALAVAVGSSHAMLTRDAVLDDALIAEIAGKVSTPLVLHGSSGVPDAGLASAVRSRHVEDQHRHSPQQGDDPRAALGAGRRTKRSSTHASTSAQARTAIASEVARLLGVLALRPTAT